MIQINIICRVPMGEGEGWIPPLLPSMMRFFRIFEMTIYCKGLKLSVAVHSSSSKFWGAGSTKSLGSCMIVRQIGD